MELRRVAAALGAALALLAPAGASAKCDTSTTKPPALDRSADPNAWESYFDYGVKALKGRQISRALAAFGWASRLDPRRAEPLFARWVAFHMCDLGRFERYLRDDERVVRDSTVRVIEGARALAMLRNPFVHRGLEMLVYDELPGKWRDDAVTRGMIAYANLEHDRAARLLDVAIRRQPQRYLWLRPTRAQALVALQRYDSAAGELTALRDELVRREARAAPSLYESKEWPEYALGVLYAAIGRPGPAREALGRALAEDLSFFPAHIALGDLALAAGRTDEAVREYEAALEVSPHDPVALLHLGRATYRTRPEAAAAALEKLVAGEPYFAAAWYYLGLAREAAGDRAGAAAAYRAFLERAPRSEQQGVDAARRRLDALGATPPG